jgi:purine-nucleoside/S-methyl-5'-thioadenosine phosphorylase / adenosine deaminase
MSEEQPRFLHPDWPAPANVRALNTLRHGGASAGVYASFNLGGRVGDDPGCVAQNRARLRADARLPADPLWLTQVHGTRVVDVAATTLDMEADGSYARRPRLVCGVLTADCLPIFICNRSGSEVGLLHAGWRGLAAGIVEAGLDALQSPAEELLVWFGPAIGPRAYEVGAEVRAAFTGHDARAADAFAPGAGDRWYMDLYRVARQRLAAREVTAIYGGGYCTATQPDLFFSYRRDGVTGRMASLIWFE